MSSVSYTEGLDKLVMYIILSCKEVWYMQNEILLLRVHIQCQHNIVLTVTLAQYHKNIKWFTIVAKSDVWWKIDIFTLDCSMLVE